MSLQDKISSRKAKVGVIGLGYVGLPLACGFAKAGFEVVGIDVDAERVKALNEGKSYIIDVKDMEVRSFVEQGKLRGTTDYSVVRDLDTINICVPTPLRKTKEPDISFIIQATDEIKKYLKPGKLMILESTTYPGTTREVVLPVFESTGLKVGKDFFLAFSPERVDPGNKVFTTQNIPKVVSGITRKCTQAAASLYKTIVDDVVEVSSPEVAETVKLLENTFRSVNIALVNELALMCNKMGINVWEVIEAAATKPFGFMPFYPGPGLGGHCIPLDPYYLSWKARMFGFEARFIELASHLNAGMPHYVVERITDALNSKSKGIKDSKILIIGVAYKKNINDMRESPALTIMDILIKKGAKVAYNDPYVKQVEIDGKSYKSASLGGKSKLSSFDCAVVVTGHDCYNYEKILSGAKLIVDTRNVIRPKTKKEQQKVFGL